MKILLVDHLMSGHGAIGQDRLLIPGYEVTKVSTANEARILPHLQPFDIALIDLLMPAEAAFAKHGVSIEVGGPMVGIGFPLAMYLAVCGIPLIGIVHARQFDHEDPMGKAMDWFGEQANVIRVMDSVVALIHLHQSANHKDWLYALDRLQTVAGW
jgi:hypothetical protein